MPSEVRFSGLRKISSLINLIRPKLDNLLLVEKFELENGLLVEYFPKLLALQDHNEDPNVTNVQECFATQQSSVRLPVMIPIYSSRPQNPAAALSSSCTSLAVTFHLSKLFTSEIAHLQHLPSSARFLRCLQLSIRNINEELVHLRHLVRAYSLQANGRCQLYELVTTSISLGPKFTASREGAWDSPMVNRTLF